MFEQIRLFMYAVMVIAMELKRYNDIKDQERAMYAEQLKTLRDLREQQDQLLKAAIARTTASNDITKH